MPTGVYLRTPEQIERVREMSKLGHAARRLQRRTHCRRGHALTEDNIYGDRSCKACMIDRGKAYRQEIKNIPRAKDTRRRKTLRRSGWTLEQYEQAFVEQKGLCKLCGNPDPSGTLRADHNHKTKKIRNLLCNTCNTGLGLFQDNSELLRKAADYILHHGGR